MGDEEENGSTGVFNIGSAVIVPTFSRGNKVRIADKPTQWYSSLPLQAKLLTAHVLKTNAQRLRVKTIEGSIRPSTNSKAGSKRLWCLDEHFLCLVVQVRHGKSALTGLGRREPV